MVNLLKDLVKMPEKAGKNGPPEVQKYQKVSLSQGERRERAAVVEPIDELY